MARSSRPFGHRLAELRTIGLIVHPPVGRNLSVRRHRRRREPGAEHEKGQAGRPHGAVWITYQPSLPPSEVSELRAFVDKQSMVSHGGTPASRYMDLTPYPGLPSPIVVSSWGYQLKLSSPADPRLQQFVNRFRASPAYTPEYGGACTGGVGTPLPR